uniref:Uncharacterized protein n=1 Tax=Meloidogyne enterolobii TaxID=390850 RepID=A0A6V7TXE5_MELEN|nr:unnamed protein product [Meloidogyne enterolobii]
MRNYFDDKLLLFCTLIVVLMSFSINAEFQSLLIFTTRNEREKGEEYSPLLDDLEWHKMNSFQSSINDFGHTFWKIFLLRGESEPLFVDIQSAIQYDDRTKVIVGNSQSPNGIIDRIFLSPFCWRKGETEEQLAFVMCNRKLDFPLDERGWQINEKIEVGNVELKRRSDALMKKEKGGSVWIDLFTFSGVPMVSASTITSKNNQKKIIEKEEAEENEIIKEQKRKKSKRKTNKLGNDEEEIRERNVHEDENEEQEKVNKKRQRRRRKYDREVKEENEENIEEGNDEENYEKVEGGKQDYEIEDINNDEKKSNEEEKEEEVDNEEKENDGEEMDEENEEEGDEEDNDETEDNEDEEDNEGNGEDGKENEEDEDDNNDKDDNEEFDSTLSIADKKRMCRYRLSCYADKGIEIPGKYGGKEQKQENGEYIPSGKRTLGGTKLKIVDVEKKATLKDAAKQAVKKVRQQEAEGEVLREKYVYDGERVLADFWAELERKNRCKYRRSCYLSGKLPEIKQSEILQWLGGFGSSGFWKGEPEEEGNKEKKRGEDGEDVKFENMSEYEKKLFCRYRNSCYKNGIKPKINNNSITTFGIKEWNFNNLIKDLKGWLWGGMEGKQKIDKEEPKQTKLECKYRKSCYSSGKLPEEFTIDKNEEKQTMAKILEGKKVPTSVKELKLFCKYRKSCYVANAAIQQTEIIEKEKQNKNITVEEKKLIISKSMKNSSPPKK